MEDYGTSLPSNKKKRNDSEDVFGGHNLWDDDQFSQSLPPTFASNLGYSGEWDLPKSNLTFSSEFGELKMSQELNMKVESLDDLPVQLHYDYADSDQSLNQTSQPMFFNQPTQPLQSTISQPVTNAQFQPPNPQQPQLFQQQQQQNQFQPQQPNPQQPQLFQQQQPMFQPQNTQSLPFNSPQFQSPQFNSQPLQFNSNQYTQPSPFQNNGIPFLDNKQPTIQIDYNSANSNVFLQNPQATQMRQTYMELVNNNPTTPHFNPSYMAHSPLTPVTPQSPMGSTVGFGNATTLSSFIMEVESKASHFRHVSDGIQAIMLQNQKIQQHKAKASQLQSQQAQAFASQSGAELQQTLFQINQQYELIAGEIQNIIQVLQKLYNFKHLDASEIYSLNLLEAEIALEMKQLEILSIECQQKPRSVPFALFIIKQPFPKSFRQTQQIDGITVKILTGTQNKIKNLGHCRADLADATNCKTKTGASTVTGNQAEFVDGIAEFTNLAFTVGTRKKPVQLKFIVDIFTTDNITIPVESNESEKIIVKTNENQYTEAEGILLKHEVFIGISEQAPWYRFTNSFQKRYLLATKQDRQRPKRPLSLQDFHYIYTTKFANSIPNDRSTININAFDAFWNWFGPVLYRIRYQRHLLPLWLSGYICGFVGKQESEKILENASKGAFLIRFSEQRAGELAIAYIPLNEDSDIHNAPTNNMGAPTTRVRHYLLQADDIYAAKKTLPDFLGKCYNLSHIVQVFHDPVRGRVYQQIRKDIVLGEYYSKVGKQDIIPGYEKQL